ncbi:head-tail connector protein [Sphingomonas soli]|uniref:head-tail connector protein n=1 Tax=Sphingomonas soli TaxID=266127 RepID=UPI00083139F1|nr:head-tail connector protein [Sphingomonas soli]
MDAPPIPAAALEAARDAAKAQLRIAGDAEDALIQGYAASALALCEAFTGRATILREWRDVMPVSRAWQALEVAGVSAITGVAGLSADGDTIAFSSDAYAVDVDAGGIGWVRTIAPGVAGRISVTFSAGMAEEWAELPAPIAQGVVLLIAHLFEAREGASPPAAVSALWRPWRRLRLAGPERAA